MASEKKSNLAFAAVLLSSVLGVGCKSGGRSAPSFPGSASPEIPVSVSYPDQYSISRPMPATPVATQSTQASSVASSAASQFCPVTGAKLGSMGEPVPVVIDGRTIYVCCQACVGKLKENPQKYLRAAPASSSGYLDGPTQKDTSRHTPNDASGSSCGSGGGGCGSACH